MTIEPEIAIDSVAHKDGRQLYSGTIYLRGKSDLLTFDCAFSFKDEPSLPAILAAAARDVASDLSTLSSDSTALHHASKASAAPSGIEPQGFSTRVPM